MLASISIRVRRPATLDPSDTSYTVVSLVSVLIKYQCTLIQMKSYPFRATQPGWRYAQEYEARVSQCGDLAQAVDTEKFEPKICIICTTLRHQ